MGMTEDARGYDGEGRPGVAGRRRGEAGFTGYSNFTPG